MKKQIWFIAAALLFVFEWLRVYFIMPMPGSQQWNTLDFAYWLHTSRWSIRIPLTLTLVYGIKQVWTSNKKSSITFLLLITISVYLTNFPMDADHMFLKMGKTQFENASKNKVDLNRLVLGVVFENQARAYPINILAHHHQVLDTSTKSHPILATYCSVCRTGMIYQSPVKNGSPEVFRLVGMDHFNAMFEDELTGSWWQQATGEAVAGSRKGEQMKIIPAIQTTLKQWLALYPNSLILQEDADFARKYRRLDAYDKGDLKSDLLRREVGKMHPKNWVAWIKFQAQIKSYSWEELEKRNWIIDSVGNKIFMVASTDHKSLFAFEMEKSQVKTHYSANEIIQLQKVSKPIESHQEFKHSFEYFQK